MYSHPLEVRDAEQDLDHRAQIAAVAQVLDACVTRTEHRFELHARLLDHLPFTDPRPGVIVCVVTVLCLQGGRERDSESFTEEPNVLFSGGIFVRSVDNPLFSASAACRFQSVTSALKCEGPTRLPPPQMSRRLKAKDQRSHKDGLASERGRTKRTPTE